MTGSVLVFQKHSNAKNSDANSESCQTSNPVKAVNYFSKTLHYRSLIGFGKVFGTHRKNNPGGY